MTDAHASVTLVICTHNRADQLARMLDSILQLDRPDGLNVDLMVVANACTDETADLLKDYAQQYGALAPSFPTRWIEEPVAGKSFALNHAIAELKSDYAVFLDDDQRIAPDFLEALETCLREHSDYTMYCGRLLPDWDGSEPAWVHDSGQFKIYPSPITTYDPPLSQGPIELSDPLPPGGNIVIRSDVFKRTGGFETALGPRGHDLMGGEDMEFLHRALNGGETMLFCPGLLQHHYVDPERLRLLYLMRKSYQRSKASVQTQDSGPVGVPKYIWKKLFIYLGQTVLSVNWTKSRFYAIRFAAALGELQGMLHNTSNKNREQ